MEGKRHNGDEKGLLSRFAFSPLCPFTSLPYLSLSLLLPFHFSFPSFSLQPEAYNLASCLVPALLSM